MKRAAALILALAIMLLCGCGQKSQVELPPNPTCEILMETGDVIRLELFYEYAPNTVANFVSLAQRNFYDGLTFHRVIAGYWIQGGDPLGDNTGGPGYCIRGEFANNGFPQNRIAFTRGVVAMARRVSDYDSAGSQFFIMQSDYPKLYGDYAAFGRVMDQESLATVDKIASTQVDTSDKPLTEWRIKTITVDDKGYVYKPEIIQESDGEEDREENEEEN